VTVLQDQSRRIAILKPCCIGDCIMALPAVDAIVVAYEDATVDVFVGRHSRIVFQFRRGISTRPVPDSLDLQSAMQLSRVLRQGRYDMVICLDRSRWLQLATRLSRSRATGHARSLTPELRHESEVYLDAVRELGIQTRSSIPWVYPTPRGIREAQELLSGINRPIVILHPGGAQNPGATMLDKRWPAERFAELARLEERNGSTVLLSGGPGDLAVVERVAQLAKLGDSAILAGTVGLDTLAAVINRAAVFVGPDTGVTHIAAAVGTPTVAIFGPTNPRRYRPLGRHVQVLAPPESWRIPDRDFRRRTGVEMAISTDLITSEMVVEAVRHAFSSVHGFTQCEE